jgi:transcriptional regulator with GAF, ATPase, and Fis domain
VVSTHDEDLLGRLSTTAEAIASLRDVFAAEEPLDEVLTRIANTARDATRDADVVSITTLPGSDGDVPRTVAYTDAQALRLDDEQYRSGRGPCLEAAQKRAPVRMRTDSTVQRWPEFVAAARSEGVRASLSVPLLVNFADRSGQEMVGSLNIYSRSDSAFDPFDEQLMSLFTVAASHAISNSRRWQHSRDVLAQLERALTSRTDIDQAKGALRAVHGYGAEAAFNALLNESQSRNVKLRAIARELLDSLSTEQTSSTDETGGANR